jgi:AcrR family transcriptional regulator
MAKSNKARTSKASRPRKAAPARRKREFKPRDAEVAQKALLEAAMIEFSQFGLEGANIERIAKACDLNKRMVYYYFGTKEGLYLRTLEHAFRSIREAERRIPVSLDKPLESLMTAIDAIFKYYVENPVFVSLISMENLSGGEYAAKIMDDQLSSAFTVGLFKRIIDAGVSAGIFRRGINTSDLYLSLASLGFMYVANRHTLRITFNRNVSEGSEIEIRRRIIHEMILNFVKADAIDLKGTMTRWADVKSKMADKLVHGDVRNATVGNNPSARHRNDAVT